MPMSYRPQYGDEGKARVVDMLAKDYDVIARFNGEGNAAIQSRLTKVLSRASTNSIRIFIPINFYMSVRAALSISKNHFGNRPPETNQC